MDWDTRFNIIKGICQGLHFLHGNSIIHMDLNPKTIFLDDEMEPKIASFGLSRLFGAEQTRVNTLNVVGANGYMPPEYMYRGEISAQADIYSLGLVIIETTTGEKNIPKKNEPSAREFIDEVRQKWTQEYMESVYKQLNSDQLQQVKVCIEIGLECVEIDRTRRPYMEYIIDCLSGRRPTTSSSDSYLVVQPPQLRFLSEPKRSTTRFLYLTNSTKNPVAFRLLTETPRRYLTKLPLCGIVPPNCTYTLCVTMREHVKAPPSNSNQFLTLQTRQVLSRYGEYVDKPDSVPEFLERASGKVQEVKVTVSYELPARRSIFRRKQKNQSVQREIEIIDGQNYRQVLSVDIHPMEPWILTSNQRGYACIWNYQTQAEVHCFEVSREEPGMLFDFIYSAKFIEREEWLVVGGGDGYIYVYRYDTMEEVTSVGAHDGRRPVTSLAVHPTHSLVLSASDDDLIKLWDWKNDWQCTRTFEWQNKIVTQVMFDPNDSNSFASTSLEGTVKIWNSSSGMCIITLGHPYGLHCLHYVTCDNRQLLVSGSSNGAATIWDLQTDRCVDTLKGHKNHLNALWWHPELPVLITGSADGTVQIWKFTDNTYRLESIIGFSLGSVNALGYMKTLKRIVVGCEQGIAMMEVNLP
uniref:Uncharacterized protein n=1 Tax=Avena sativa TaxID=4498 RepID=A0ACD5WPN4_AVESA